MLVFSLFDGNIKNARLVCSCRDVGGFMFAVTDGSESLLVSSNLIIMFGHTVFTKAS